MSDLQDTVQQWLRKGYLAAASGKSGKYVLTPRFYDALKTEQLVEDFDRRDRKRAAPPPPEIVVDAPLPLPAVTRIAEPSERNGITITSDGRVNGLSYSELFIHFITAAQVPQKVLDTRGQPYIVNKYNEKAAAALCRLIVKEGIDLALLIRSTMLYYKGANRFKKTVGNYITEGDWRSDYMALCQHASQGVEALDKHIREETTNAPGYNGYQLG
jgi:hypothetical protein